MRVAVITPYYQEDVPTLERCRGSVFSQDHAQVTQIFVADGNPSPFVASMPGIEHMIMPGSHQDAGATPRALAAISAFSRGYDSVAFLDADNTIEPFHVSMMARSMEDTGAGVVTATRNICTRDGSVLYPDRIESNGEDFCDTNCLFIGRPCLHLLTCWVTEPSARLWSDRQFWSAILQSGTKRSHCLRPSVNYHSRWAWHYQQAGVKPPGDSVWIDRLGDGTLIHRKHSN